MLAVAPTLAHFGVVATHAWADQLVRLTNGCATLPLRVVAAASGPFFAALPRALELPPGGSAEVVLRYRPKALGHHQAAMCFRVVSDSSQVAGAALHEASVALQGSSLSVGPKPTTLPGGPAATPDTFTLPR